MDTPVTDLEQRYRGPSRASRVVALVVVVALAASGVGLLGWAFVDYGRPDVTSSLTSYEVVDEHAVRATFSVSRASQFTDATCRLVAIAEDHAEVGEAVVPVVDGPERQALQLEIRTARRATSVDLLGCTTAEQARPR